MIFSRQNIVELLREPRALDPAFHINLSSKGLFHPACFARVVSWFAFVVAIFMAHVQGMLDETDSLSVCDSMTDLLYIVFAEVGVKYPLRK